MLVGGWGWLFCFCLDRLSFAERRAAQLAPALQRAPALAGCTPLQPAMPSLAPAVPPCFLPGAGLDSAEIVSQMRAAHAADPEATSAGVDVTTDGVGDMQQVGRSASGQVLVAGKRSASRLLRAFLHASCPPAHARKTHTLFPPRLLHTALHFPLTHAAIPAAGHLRGLQGEACRAAERHRGGGDDSAGGRHHPGGAAAARGRHVRWRRRRHFHHSSRSGAACTQALPDHST